MKIVSLSEAVSIVQSENRVFIQGAAMTPNKLIDSLCERHTTLRDIEIISIHTEGEAPYTLPPYSNTFRLNSCFVGGNVRNTSDGNRKYTRCRSIKINRAQKTGNSYRDVLRRRTAFDRTGYHYRRGKDCQTRKNSELFCGGFTSAVRLYR